MLTAVQVAFKGEECVQQIITMQKNWDEIVQTVVNILSTQENRQAVIFEDNNLIGTVHLVRYEGEKEFYQVSLITHRRFWEATFDYSMMPIKSYDIAEIK
jgi:hypothetical protein